MTGPSNTQWPRDVFILGAGFSHQIATAMPLTRELFELCTQALHELEAEVVDDDIVMGAHARWDKNLEIWLTWLGSEQPWLTEVSRLRNRAAFGEVAQALGLVIVRAQNAAMVEPKLPPWFVNLLRAWGNRGVTVITLNYDALIEKAYEELTPAGFGALLYGFMPQPMSGGARYGGPGPSYRFNLFKLHGSVTWYIYPTGESGGSMYGPVYDPELERGWKSDNEAALLLRAGGRHPMIVPPVLIKDPFFGRPELRDHWLRSDLALQRAERLFFIGYSLPDGDLTMKFLLDRANFDCQITVVDWDADVGTRVKQLMKPRSVDLTLTGRDTVIDEFVESYVRRVDGQVY